jgi:hypothetical protein
MQSEYSENLRSEQDCVTEKGSSFAQKKAAKYQKVL